ncbi:MAG: hypothetical protein ACLQF0_05580 [Dissulfurispiraceae bacterium]
MPMPKLVDIESKEFQVFLERAVLKVVQKAILSKPTEDQFALLLHTHIKDMALFRQEVENRLAHIEADIEALKQDVSILKQDVSDIKVTMMTKDFWAQEKQRLITGIGAEFRKVAAEMK